MDNTPVSILHLDTADEGQMAELEDKGFARRPAFRCETRSLTSIRHRSYYVMRVMVHHPAPNTEPLSSRGFLISMIVAEDPSGTSSPRDGAGSAYIRVGPASTLVHYQSDLDGEACITRSERLMRPKIVPPNLYSLYPEPVRDRMRVWPIFRKSLRNAISGSSTRCQYVGLEVLSCGDHGLAKLPRLRLFNSDWIQGVTGFQRSPSMPLSFDPLAHREEYR